MHGCHFLKPLPLPLPPPILLSLPLPPPPLPPPDPLTNPAATTLLGGPALGQLGLLSFPGAPHDPVLFPAPRDPLPIPLPPRPPPRETTFLTFPPIVFPPFPAPLPIPPLPPRPMPPPRRGTFPLPTPFKPALKAAAAPNEDIPTPLLPLALTLLLPEELPKEPRDCCC